MEGKRRGLKNLGGDIEKMKKRLKQKGTALFVVVLLFMALMLVPAVSAQQQDDTATVEVPSTIKVYSLVEINPAEIKESINAGKSVNISFSGEQFELKLVLNNMRSADYKAYIKDDDGVHEIEPPEPATYKGKVVGDLNSTVRLTITQNWVRGYVSSDKGWYFIEPLNGYKKTESGDNITHFTYKTTDTEFEIDFGDDVILISEDDSLSNMSTIDSLPVTSRLTTLYADIICDGDVEFYNIDPSSWATRQATVINNVEGIYDSQMDIEFNIVGQETWGSGGPLASTDAGTLLNQLRTYWLTRSDQRDLVHLFSGKYLDGTTLGTAWQPGIGISGDYAYSLTQHRSKPIINYWANEHQKTVIVAHETGHNFNGDHSHAVTWWDGVIRKKSIMAEWGVVATYEWTFSDGTIDPNKNNVARIRAHAETYL